MGFRSPTLNLVLVFLASLMLSASVPPDDKTGEPGWSYSGSDGPDHWGSLKPEYSACSSGHRQSPINIADAHYANLSPIQFDYEPAPLKVIDNGHSIQVNYDHGNSITVDQKRYDLIQFHFHHPSEEQIQGKSYDMVIHLVHRDKDGKLVVVAVLLTKGKANGMLQTLWEHLPEQKGKEMLVKGVEINAAELLPAHREYYSFAGSLTTPPCTEGVSWFVLTTPVEVSPEEIQQFAMLYPDNARPVQPLYGRTILQTK